MLKPPGTELLKLKHDVLLSTFAFNFNSRLYTQGIEMARVAVAEGEGGALTVCS
jgi:hypothetical protein